MSAVKSPVSIGRSLLYAPARSTTQEEMEPRAMAAISARKTKKGTTHCFFTKPT